MSSVKVVPPSSAARTPGARPSGSLVYTLVVPFAAVALTLYYFDLQTRPVAAAVRPTTLSPAMGS